MESVCEPRDERRVCFLQSVACVRTVLAQGTCTACIYTKTKENRHLAVSLTTHDSQRKENILADCLCVRIHDSLVTVPSRHI